MTPLQDRVLAEIITPENKTASGIILPTDHKQKYQAKVIFVGPKTKTIKPGDTIQYLQSSGVPYDYNGKNCLLLRESRDVDFIL